MKKSIYSILSLALTLLLTFGCSRNENELVLKPDKKELLVELNQKYGSVGQEHNEAMAAIFVKLSGEIKGKQITKGSKSYHLDYVRDEGISFFQGKPYGSSNKELVEFHFNKQFSKLATYNATSQTNARLSNTSDGYFDTEIKESNVSESCKALLRELGNTMNDNSSPTTEFNKQIDAIVIKAVNTLNSEEASVIFVSGNVAKASSDYWATNVDKWLELQSVAGAANGRRKVIPLAEVRYRLAKKDCAGAVGGAVVSLITGCAELTLGACLGLGALVGGAGTSIEELVEMCWESWFE